MRTDTSSRAFLVLLVMLSMLGPLTLNILVPSLPGMVDSLKATKESVQLTLSLYLLGMAVGQLMLGPLADRFGRRPVLLTALVLYVFSSLAAFIAPNVETLIVARILQSFGATAGITLARTMIRDLYSRDAAASMIAYVTMAMVVAPMVSPVLGATIDDHFGWRAILLFCSVLGLISFAIAAPILPETRPASLVAATASDVARRTVELLGNRRFMGYWGSGAFCSGMFFAFLGTAPYLMIEVLGRPKTEYGLWFMTLSLGYMIGNFFSGRFATRVGSDRLIFYGNVVGVIGALMILAGPLVGWLHPLALFIPAMIASFGNGLVLPNTIAAGVGINPLAAGAGSGLLGFGQMGIGAVASYLGGKLVTGTAMPLAIIMTVCAVLALASGWLSRRED
ncbi:MAG: multidrug effflux MFS transporter [Beijerinckiaceae bacterium]|nr:multidrug effflux MFS transporter [Beijerinckiaceae bacterium]